MYTTIYSAISIFVVVLDFYFWVFFLLVLILPIYHFCHCYFPVFLFCSCGLYIDKKREKRKKDGFLDEGSDREKKKEAEQKEDGGRSGGRRKARTGRSTRQMRRARIQDRSIDAAVEKAQHLVAADRRGGNVVIHGNPAGPVTWSRRSPDPAPTRATHFLHFFFLFHILVSCLLPHVLAELSFKNTSAVQLEPVVPPGWVLYCSVVRSPCQPTQPNNVHGFIHGKCRKKNG